MLTHLLAATLAASLAQAPSTYPATQRDGTVDNHHGTKVADPYRWPAVS